MSKQFLWVLVTALSLIAPQAGGQQVPAVIVIEEDEQASTELPQTTDLRPSFEKLGLRQRQQGSRGTCSVFTTVEAVEFAHARIRKEGVILSVEFANWAANETTGRNDDGDFFHHIIRGIEKYGICPEAAMPYSESFSKENMPETEAIRQAAEFNAKTQLNFHWIRHWSRKPGRSDEDLQNVKSVLSQGSPVCAGSYHSVLLVGYEDDPSLDGGGRFFVADSNVS